MAPPLDIAEWTFDPSMTEEVAYNGTTVDAVVERGLSLGQLAESGVPNTARDGQAQFARIRVKRSAVSAAAYNDAIVDGDGVTWRVRNFHREGDAWYIIASTGSRSGGARGRRR
jgi:hypothetical protein